MMTKKRTKVMHFTAIDVTVEAVAAALEEGVDVLAVVDVEASAAVTDSFGWAD
jgi:hypothetical protein